MNTEKNILLVQLFSNGDCLYATTIARQIKKEFPDSKLCWAIADFCKDIINNNPYVDSRMIVSEVPKSDVIAFRKFRNKVLNQQKSGIWDQVFITQNMDKNQAFYDGTIRGMIYRVFPYKITVPKQPVLVLSPSEKENVKFFVEKNRISTFTNVLLWEYAPQSDQVSFSPELIKSLAEKLSHLPSTIVILSSAKPLRGVQNSVDASPLSVRENADLLNYCTLLIGCSSGITWLNISTASKGIPMVQLLDPNAKFLNCPSTDFERNGVVDIPLIQIFDLSQEKIFQCIKMIVDHGFSHSKEVFNENIPLKFVTTRKIVYNLLCYCHFNSVLKHYSIMTSIYGKNSLFLKEFYGSIFLFPINLIRNLWRKRIMPKLVRQT